MSLIGHALFAAATVRGLQLDARSRDPGSAQQRALWALVRRARDTAFGQAHRFDQIENVESFRERVPVRGYDGLKPWLDRTFSGERNVVWPGHMPYIGMSSGTTAGNKYLPISLDSVRQQQRGGFEPIAAFLRAGGARDLLDGKAIMLGSTPQLETNPAGMLVGDNTGIMARHMPFFVRHKHLPSHRVRAMRSWDGKIEALARESVDADVRLVAGTPAWFPGLFDAVLRVARERGKSAKRILDVWPRLRLLTGGGVRYEPYRALIEERLGASIPYFDVYNATEGGIMGVQDRNDDAAMRMLPDTGVFFELIPIEDAHAERPRRFTLAQAEVGQVYSLVVSTMSGLFAYALGDCVRFVSTYPHRFLFEGRSTAFLNLCGEHVSQGELERAVTRACTSAGLRLTDFTVATEVGVAGNVAARHLFLLECDAGPGQAQAGALAIHIDREIAAGNEDYATHRSSRLSLRQPAVQFLQPGTFTQFMRKRGKLGGQNKVPRVLRDRHTLDELLETTRSLGPSVQL